MNEPILKLNNIHKSFRSAAGKVNALNDVNLEILPGQTLGLVGESGSGKTTLGRVIIGLLQADSGQIRFRDQLITKKFNVRSPALRGHLQFVFQEPSESLDPRLSVGRIIAEPLIGQGVDKSLLDDRIAGTLELIGLDAGLLGKLPGEISAGMQQKVGIARALVTNPDLVVLDEPTSALDPKARADLLETLAEVQEKTSVSYILISHDLSTVRSVTDVTAVMYLGEIVEVGKTETVFTRPKHPYTAALLDAVLLPLPGLFSESEERLKGEIPSPIDLPKGCYLATRCRHANDTCRASHPDLVVRDDVKVRCSNMDALTHADSTSSRFETFDKTIRLKIEELSVQHAVGSD
ncbi:MAG: ABC transporter ATP-binding protein [Alphaproteobacteria bacterium]|nr:ABC transporter ATP-binding protein [Alphaproteobacteria bacterium]